ncbi:MAG: hypothetical protein V4577_20390, partial [Bacteroidota bacterium]
IITPAIIDSLKKDGLKINDGLTPPAVEGNYFFSPDYCTYDNSGGGITIYADLTFSLTNQNKSASTISLKYKTPDSEETGSDFTADYISGSNNFFTVFAQANDTTHNIPSVLLEIISGEFTSSGIKNMQFAFYSKSKGPDPDNLLVPVGTTRIFEDEDGFSETRATFSTLKKVIQNNGNNLSNPHPLPVDLFRKR